MRISRNLNDLELKLLYSDPKEFFLKETFKLGRFLTKQAPDMEKFKGYLWLNGRELIGDFPEVGKPVQAPAPEKIREEDVYADPLHRDPSLGCYRLTLWLPEVKSEDIKISKANSLLKVKAGAYEKDFSLPSDIFEIRKTYKGGVLDIMLY
jgi:HSP20 family molecular chaperone IbpA